jgi:hypothetical protein
MSSRIDLPQCPTAAKVVSLLACLALLGGCATAKNFNNALAEPVATSSKAAEVVASAAADVLRANAFGLVESPPANPIELVCATQEGLRGTTINLRQFSEALEAVDKVASKPDDTSFSGYISQIRKNQEAIAAAGGAPNAEQQIAAKKRVAEYNRCKALFSADWNANPRLSADSAMQLHGMTPTLGIILAFRDLALTLLKYGEAAQREEAIKATVASLVPQLDEAVKRLAAPLDPAAFGSHVVYASSASPLALEMNKSNLGASLSIQRWMTAMQIRGSWENLAACRKAQSPATCMGNADARANAADFAVQIASYRNLAKINDQSVLEALGGAVKKARKASDGKASLAEIMDALFGIGDAVADIADKADAIKKAKD